LPSVQGNKKPLLRGEEVKTTRSSHLFLIAADQAGFGTWTLKIALQPVAVVSSGQSLNHS